MKKVLKAIIILAGTFILLKIFNVQCLFKSILGVPCPGCGLTRAVEAFLHGNLREAFYWHPLFFIAPIVLFLVISDLEVIRKINKKYMNIIIFILIGVFLGVYAIRMVTLFPTMPPMDYNYESILYKLIF